MKALTSSAAILTLALTVGTWAPAAAGEEPGGGELVLRLLPVFRQAQADPTVQARLEQLKVDPFDRAAQDRLLEALPLSPLEWLRCDMHLRRYEIAVPEVTNQLHRRWVRLHPAVARAHYGDAYVDQLLARAAAETPAVEGGGAAPKAEVGTNRNLAADFTSPPTDYQGEIQIAVNPSNPNQIIAGANTMAGCPGDATQAIFYSSDGGSSWGMTCAPSAAAFGMTCSYFMVIGSDPAVWWDDANHAHFEYMLVCTLLGLLNQFSVVVADSADGGQTWSANGVLVNSWGSQDIEDKEFYAIDVNPSSPYYGRHYSCWDRNNNETAAYSTNGGSSWTLVDLPAAPSGGTDLGCELAVAKNGHVHVIWDSLTCSGSTCTNEQMFHTRSTNGGVSWSSPVLVQDFNLVSFSEQNKPAAQDSRGINPFGSVDVDNSGGACDGTLYATFSDYTTGTAENCDVHVKRSLDGGATWSSAVRVNDDGAGGRNQFHPFLMVDQSNGAVVVAWHDARNDPSNRAVDYFLARSTDCGLTFEANIQVSQPSAEFNNATISSTNESTAANANANPNQYGEYMGLDVVDGTAYLAWCDSRHFFPGSTSEAQKENVGFAKVTFGAAPETPLFADGFESGGTGNWSATAP